MGAVSRHPPRVILRAVPFDDDAEADVFRFRPPPHPDDRLWRHPSELGPGRGEGAGARDRQTGRPWGVAAVAGTAGAVLAGAGVLAFGLGERIVDRPVVERVALDTVSSAPRAADQSADGIRQQVAPAVVAVEGRGSGILVRDDGIVLTSASVVDESGRLSVRLPDGSSTEAEVVGSDPTTGIAVLDLEGHDYRTGLLATEAGLVQGQTSFTVSVGAAGGATTVAALVGATRRYHTPAGATLDAVVETSGDAPAHALGGPLVNARGVVVGIVTGVDDGSASYVVPVEVARKVAEDLVAVGKVERCWLGIEGSDAADPRVTGGGVRIASVAPDSPADRGGLRVGDVLVEVDGRMIGHLPDLMITLRSRSPGDQIAATVVRDDNPTTLSVTLGSQSRTGA
jgi:S1-C subfamily serine protease